MLIRIIPTVRQNYLLNSQSQYNNPEKKALTVFYLFFLKSKRYFNIRMLCYFATIFCIYLNQSRSAKLCAKKI